MLSHNAKIVEPPPPYEYTTSPPWFHRVDRYEAEDLIHNYINLNNLGLRSDRLFLVRPKTYNLFVISIYRYKPKYIYHHLLEKVDNHFILDSNIIIDEDSLNKTINRLIHDIEVGYRVNDEIIPLINNYVINRDL